MSSHAKICQYPKEPLICINQEICEQKPNLSAILWKILFHKNVVEITMIFMKITEFALAMHHGKF